MSFLTGDAPTESLPAHFERIVKLHGARLAIGGGAWQPTYAELNAAANRIAHALMQRRTEIGDRVAILMNQDAPMIAGIIGIIKAGRIAVVINPTDPPARLKLLTGNVGAKLILTDTANEPTTLEFAATGQILRFEDAANGRNCDDPALNLSAHSPAFIIHTSGTTGEPNGIVHPHSAAIATAETTVRMLDIVPDDRVLMLASAGGGQGIGVILMALLTGASLWPFMALDKGVRGLADWLSDHSITVCTWSASIFRHLVRTIDDNRKFPAVHSIRMTSEKATTEDFRAFQRHFSDSCTLNYSLASSEAGQITRFTLQGSDHAPEGDVLPIGSPHDGVEITLIDDAGRPVGPGEAGQLVVTSWSVALGIWGNPTLTAQRYFTRPDAGGRRSLHTGDIARWNKDGVLEFIDRKNRRLKIRGHSIDPLEIEQTLRNLLGIGGATVNVFERPGVEPQLVAFVIALHNATPQNLTAGVVRAQLRRLLPRHLIPAAIVFVDEFPLSANGKLDHVALLEAYETARDRHEQDQPATETESRLARVWAKVLGLPTIGRLDDFFELGGDSLNASVVAAILNDEIGVEIDLGVFFEHPKLSDLAQVIDLRASAPADPTLPLVSIPDKVAVPLSLVQEGIWIHSQQPANLLRYGLVKVYRAMGPLNADILRQCMTEMVRRHEHLRTTVELVDGYPVQIVHPPHPISLPIAELRRDIASSAAIAEIAAEEYRKPFDFSRLPVMRFSLYRVDSNEHWLVQASHHITSDALSGRLYYEELSELYSAATGQAETNRPDPALHYGDYAVWQRELLRKDQLAYRRALTWWRRNLSETQPLKLPFARETALVDAKPADGWIKFEIKPETTRQLDALARDHSVTPYTVRLAAFLVHLASETGQFDLALGMYVGNRHRIALQSMLGLFANLVTVRVRFDPTLAFFEWLVMVGKRVGEAEAHGELPHHLLQEAMNDTGAPLPPIEAIFSVRPSQRQFQIADIEVVAGDRTPTSGMPWGFTLALEETGDDLPCVASFDAHRYNRKGVQMFVERFSRLLDATAYNAEGPVGVLVGQLNTEFGQSSHAPARRELKATNQHQGAISSRQFTEPRRPWRKRFRPKISAFYQYRPRKLRIPASYHADNLGAVVPSIAIVTPSYNKGRFISETIDSVLSQNYPRLNCHVQDANSSDRTTHILKSFEPRVSWHSAPDFGQAQCLNAGFKSVPGDIMSYLNSGDLLLPGTLAYVVNAFAGDKRLDFVYGHRICIDEQGQEVGRWVLPRHDRMAIKWFDFIPHETLFWRRRAWDALEGFDERCHSVFDWDFVLRAHAQGMQFARLPRFLGCLRIQDGQNTIESLTARSAESNLLRRQHLGFEPNTRKISRAAVRYWRRSMLLRKFYSLMC